MNIPNLFYYPEEKFKKVFSVPDIGDLNIEKKEIRFEGKKNKFSISKINNLLLKSEFKWKTVLVTFFFTSFIFLAFREFANENFPGGMREFFNLVFFFVIIIINILGIILGNLAKLVKIDFVDSEGTTGVAYFQATPKSGYGILGKFKGTRKLYDILRDSL